MAGKPAGWRAQSLTSTSAVSSGDRQLSMRRFWSCRYGSAVPHERLVTSISVPATCTPPIPVPWIATVACRVLRLVRIDPGISVARLSPDTA